LTAAQKVQKVIDGGEAKDSCVRCGEPPGAYLDAQLDARAKPPKTFFDFHSTVGYSTVDRDRAARSLVDYGLLK